MEIVLERIAKKNSYTIGRLYILSDADVKRKVLSGKKAGDKRSFLHQFDLQKLSKDAYFCDTLEPTWRNLKGVELKPEEEKGKYGRESGKVARKIPGHTAIPEGSYRVLVTMSPRFKQWLPYLQGDLLDHVSHFSVANQSNFHLYLFYFQNYDRFCRNFYLKGVFLYFCILKNCRLLLNLYIL